ncbi:MAG: T9SS type A sorting domain-containing protein [Saprospiraceae bacterium]|nr:T9SS type A sorting domain-containing protein [Saprospiraceae bacterium]
MKTTIKAALAGAAAFLLWAGANAQCPHDPTVTGNLLLCPESTSILSTQQYDSYQWYKRPFSGGSAQPIPNATSQTLEVDAYYDTPSYISVAATLNGCAEQSPEVLVDGLAFLPVTVSSFGDFSISPEGELIICSGDTVWMEVLLPYTLNIQWYNDWEPIAGANNDTLVVTTPGNYSVSASPTECPDWTASLGLTIPVIWGNTPGCLTSVKAPQEMLQVDITPNPATSRVQVTVADFAPVSLVLLDVQGKIVRERTFAEQTTLDVADLPKGVYVMHLTSKQGSAVRKLVVE